MIGQCGGADAGAALSFKSGAEKALCFPDAALTKSEKEYIILI